MHLTFRTDASPQLGTGHAMRCLALAQAWQDAGRAGRNRNNANSASFAMSACPPALEDRLTREGIAVLHLAGSITPGSEADAHETAAIARERSAASGDDWVAIDGYHFNADYQASMQALGLRILFWDDNAHCSHYSADLVLNQNIHARPEMYPSLAPATELLLGTRYAVLRREFNAYRGWQRTIPESPRTVLIMMGGSDPANLTPRAIEAITLTPGEFAVTVVVGGSNPHLAAVEAAAASSPHRVTLIRDASNMAEVMANADLALSAAGSTCWELCFLGLPSVLVAVAENQQQAAQALHQSSAAILAPSGTTTSAKELAFLLTNLAASAPIRAMMSQRGRALVDGLGAARIVAHLLERPEPA